MSEGYRTALQYVEQGFRVFTCRKGSKAPATPNGWHDATRDKDELTEMFARDPQANIAIVIEDGFCVIDVDEYKPGAAFRFEELCNELGDLPDCPTQITARGGKHLLFRVPTDVPLRHGTEVFGGGVDFLVKGYILVQNAHIDGAGSYVWDNAIDELSGAPYLPDAWIRAAMIPRSRTPREQAPAIKSHTWAAFDGVGYEKYASAALDAECRRVLDAPAGTKNEVIFKAAACVGELVIVGALSHADAFARLFEAASHRDMASSDPDGDDKLIDCIDRGLDQGKKNPRSLPERDVDRRRAEREASLPSHEPDLMVQMCNDLGNADRLIGMYGDDLRYVHEWGRWITWDGKRWDTRSSGLASMLAEDVSRAYLRQVSEHKGKATGDASEAEKGFSKHHERWARASASNVVRGGMLKAAEHRPEVAMPHDALDVDPWLLNLSNGIINVKTGQFQPHNPLLLCSRLAGASYDAGAKCPKWESLASRIFNNDAGLIAFVRRSMGIALTGDVSEQYLWFLHGGGGNGKSTLAKVMCSLLGEYYHKANDDFLVTDGRARHPTEFVGLFNRRLVTCAEPNQAQSLDEGRVKALTGGEQIAARGMRQDFWSFDPTFKLWVQANHKPKATADDFAIWRRILLVPFEVFVPPSERETDIDAQLERELPGILNWCLDGASDWLTNGLNPPQSVTDATDRYRTETDPVGMFLGDEDWVTVDPAEFVSSQRLYKVYRQWCEENGRRPVASQKLGRTLTRMGYLRVKEAGVRGWHGITAIVPPC